MTLFASRRADPSDCRQASARFVSYGSDGSPLWDLTAVLVKPYRDRFRIVFSRLLAVGTTAPVAYSVSHFGPTEPSPV